jgi:hypothetical protein
MKWRGVLERGVDRDNLAREMVGRVAGYGDWRCSVQTGMIPVGYAGDDPDIASVVSSAAVLVQPLFVFLPKIIRRGMREDTDAVIDAFGKNEHIRKVFWTVFIAMAGLVLARVVDPVTAQQVVGIITGTV